MSTTYKTVTQQIVELSTGIVSVGPEVSQPDGPYKCFDSGAVEVETGEFLYGLVRILKPQEILETGTYTGVSSLYMGLGLRDNGFGHLVTLEIEDFHRKRAQELWLKLNVDTFVTCNLIDSARFDTHGKMYELIFLDSEPGLRFGELLQFYPSLKPGGFIGIHDLPNTLCQGNINPDHPEIPSYPYGDVPEAMKELIRTDQLRVFHFPTPRGITFFYKPKEGDYRP